jgi:predicted RNA-binding Zn-ribbon protein involved in translation (DUF1610 family)
MMTKKLEFVCPNCGHDDLEEVMVNCVVSTPIWFEDNDYYYGNTEIIYGDVDRHQCVVCGFVIRTNCTLSGESSGDVITERDELREWLIAMRDERGD